MGNSTPIFFDYSSNNLDVFAEQYVMEYDKLRQQYPWWSIETLMRVAKEITIEYLYLKLKEELKANPIWPIDFIIPENGQ